MKNLIIITLFFSVNAFAQKKDKYEAYLAAVQESLGKFGTQLNVNTPNPFITGTALSNYYMNEKILLLERDAYFMMKSNKLSTTEEIADYQHRLKVLTSHANNILLGMVRGLQNAKQEGFLAVEAPKHQMQWEELLELCKKNPDCVNKKLDSGAVVLQNDIVDSFALSTQLFRDVPYMHAIEFASMYQLVQLLYMESVVGHSKVGRVEFEVFLKKQKKVAKEIDENKQLTVKEKQFHRTVVVNTVNKWKKKILARKFDQKAGFKTMALKLRVENQVLIAELDKLRKANPDILSEAEICRQFMRVNKDKKKCELRAKVEKNIDGIRNGESKFLDESEKKLPNEFFESI